MLGREEEWEFIMIIILIKLLGHKKERRNNNNERPNTTYHLLPANLTELTNVILCHVVLAIYFSSKPKNSIFFGNSFSTHFL